MPGFELEDVEVGFEYDTLIVEGKREGEHYIAGVRVPEGFHREDRLVKREMEDGVFKATLPRVDANRIVFSVYR
ncbi:putative alpha crystallin/Hsp20 domain, HSP20-like chaperone [Helianthus anomalus]